MKEKECGNILFLILICVSLFAALSYVVTQGSRSGAGAISREKSNLLAAGILSQMETFNMGVLQLSLHNNCSADQLNPYNTTYKRVSGALTHTVNTNAPIDGRCDLFSGSHPLPLLFAPRDAIIPDSQLLASDPIPGAYNFRGKRILGVGTDSLSEVTVGLGSIRREVCLSMMEELGITGTNIPNDEQGTTQLGALATPIADPIGDESTILVGRNLLVVTTSNNQNSCLLLSVLVAR